MSLIYSKPEVEPKPRTWTIKITVSENWIEDGFTMTDDKLQSIADVLLPYAIEGEVTVKVQS